MRVAVSELVYLWYLPYSFDYPRFRICTVFCVKNATIYHSEFFFTCKFYLIGPAFHLLAGPAGRWFYAFQKVRVEPCNFVEEIKSLSRMVSELEHVENHYFMHISSFLGKLREVGKTSLVLLYLNRGITRYDRMMISMCSSLQTIWDRDLISSTKLHGLTRTF